MGILEAAGSLQPRYNSAHTFPDGANSTNNHTAHHGSHNPSNYYPDPLTNNRTTGRLQAAGAVRPSPS